MAANDNTPPDPLRQSPRRRKGTSYLLPVLLMVAGIFVATWGVVRIIRLSSGSGIRIEVPGQMAVDVPKSGDYRLWLETRSIVDGSFQTFPDTLPPGSRITVRQWPERTIIEQEMSGNMSMSVNGTKRVALTKMTLPRVGEYLFETSGLEEKRVLYLDEASSVQDFFKAVGTAMLGGFLLLGGAIWSIISLTRSGL